MPLRTLVLFCCLIGCFAQTLSAQNLLADSQRLLAALHTAQDTLRTTAVRQQAARQAVLVLYRYDEAAQWQAPNYIDVPRLLRRIRENPLLGGLLTPPVETQLLATPPTGPWKADWDSLETPTHRRLIKLLYGDAPVSPLQYLSATEAVGRNRVPPLQDSAILRRRAALLPRPEPVAMNASQQILNGLFRFVLQRAQQEVAISFFEGLLDKRLPQVKDLFPHVAAEYSASDFTYSEAYIATLREAFFFDLRELNVRLPNLLLHADYFAALQENPVFYNVMTMYGMFALSIREGASWEEILAITHHDLYKSYEAATDKLNEQLTETPPGEAAYTLLIQRSRLLLDQLDRVSDSLIEVESALRIRNLQLGINGKTPVDESLYINDSVFTYRALIGESEQAGFSLAFLPQLLAGKLNDTTLQQYNSLARYDQYFNPPSSPHQLRRAGVELVRNLNGVWYNDRSIVDITREWQHGLARYEAAINANDTVITEIDAAQALRATEARRAAMAAAIAATRSFYAGRDTSGNLDALFLLGVIASDFAGLPDGGTALDSVKRRQERLSQLTQRLLVLEKRLPADTANPLRPFLHPRPPTPVSAGLTPEIAKLEQRLNALQRALTDLEKSRAARQTRIRQQPLPLMQLTELLSQLLMSLRIDSSWLSRDSLTGLRNDTLRYSAFLGLLEQRLTGARSVGVTAPGATARLLTATLEDIWSLQPDPNQILTDSLKKARLFNHLSVGLQAFGRVVEMPLFPNPSDNPDSIGRYVPLKRLYPRMERVPAITRYSADFLYYLHIGQYRPGVAAFTRLLNQLSKEVADADPSAKRSNLLRFFDEYGDFIAGLVDSKTQTDMSTLLQTIADPPGSSRIKRTSDVSVGLNGYLGLNAGVETWKRQRSDDPYGFAAVGPTIPIGITFSRLFKGSFKTPQSFSLHVSVLDLGSILTFRLADEATYGADKVTFKNILRPGLQLHWNLPKSPFYVGVGWQTGIQFRQQGEEELALRSSRWMLGIIGVDVPVLTLYRR